MKTPMITRRTLLGAAGGGVVAAALGYERTDGGVFLPDANISLQPTDVACVVDGVLSSVEIHHMVGEKAFVGPSRSTVTMEMVGAPLLFESYLNRGTMRVFMVRKDAGSVPA